MTLRNDGIWISDKREPIIIKDLSKYILDHGYVATIHDSNNFGYPYGYQKDNQRLHCRFVDSVFQPTPDAWTDPNATIVTDNHALRSVAGKVISLLPELWHMWRFGEQGRNQERWIKQAKGGHSQVRGERVLGEG